MSITTSAQLEDILNNIPAPSISLGLQKDSYYIDLRYSQRYDTGSFSAGSEVLYNTKNV